MAFLLEWIPAACQAGIGRKILRGRCSEAAPGRKRYHFRRGTGYQPPAGQENASIPARKVLRGGSGQKKASFPARNGMPTACRAGKHSKSCAEGASESFGAEKGIISCAERDANRLLSRKIPQILRGRCIGGFPSRKTPKFRRGMGYHPPAEQKIQNKFGQVPNNHYFRALKCVEISISQCV